MLSGRILGSIVSVSLLVGAVLTPATARGPARVDFRTQVKPIFQAKCVGCHSTASPSGGLALDTKEGVRKGGNSGRLYKVGRSAESLLYKRLKGTGGTRMPMGSGPLADSQIRVVRKWVDEGARM